MPNTPEGKAKRIKGYVARETLIQQTQRQLDELRKLPITDNVNYAINALERNIETIREKM